MQEPTEIHRIFKVVARQAWEEACRQGTLSGSADDLRDGFIHLSASHQLSGTLAKHFTGQADLFLIELDVDALRSNLRWERSRDGNLFPHLYAALPTAAALVVYELRPGADGVPIVPEDAKIC